MGFFTAPGQGVHSADSGNLSFVPKCRKRVALVERASYTEMTLAFVNMKRPPGCPEAPKANVAAATQAAPTAMAASRHPRCPCVGLLG